jgi:hypothetical protein
LALLFSFLTPDLSQDVPQREIRPYDNVTKHLGSDGF